MEDQNLTDEKVVDVRELGLDEQDYESGELELTDEELELDAFLDEALEDLDMQDRGLNDIQHRYLKMDKKVIDEDTRRVRIALSSEEPVERKYGKEVLGHRSDEIDMEFAKSGRMPLLLDHDMTKQVGVVEEVELGSDARLRATVRFGKGALAREAFDDVFGGIKGNISVGYEVKKMVKEEREGGTVYRATSWRPMEVSLVSVPADVTVGVGRAKDMKVEPQVSIKEDIMSEETKVAEAASREAQYRREVSEIIALGDHYNKESLAGKAVREGKSLEQFKDELLKEVATKPLSLADIGATEAEKRSYSLMSAIRSASAGRLEGFEYEVSQELEKRYNKAPRGFYIPTDIFKRDVTTTAPVAGPGSNLVPTDHLGGEFIDALRDALVISGLGARMMQGLEGNVAIPKLTAKTAVGFVSENNAPGTEGAPQFGQVTMSPKGMVQFVDLSRRLMYQSDPSVEAIVRDDMVRQFAAKIDSVAIQGGGANEPTGILETSGIANIYIDALGDSGDGGALTYAKLVELEKEVAIDNALTGRLAFLTNPKVISAMRTTPRQASGVEGNFIMNDTNQIMGYQVVSTNLVPSDLTTSGGGSALSAVVFGDYSSLMVGMFGGLDVLVDPYSNSGTGATRIAMYQDIDVAVRHPESFAALIDVDA